MANYQTRKQTGVGTSEEIIPINGNPFSIGFGCIVTGTVTYNIEHTFGEDVWFLHEFVQGQTTNQDGNYAFPVEGIRINITAGTGTVQLITLQAA